MADAVPARRLSRFSRSPLYTQRGFDQTTVAEIAERAGLQERELIKLASLAVAMAEGMGRRGVGEPAAKLTAETGVAVFKVAFDRWISATKDTGLAGVVGESLDELRALTAST